MADSLIDENIIKTIVENITTDLDSKRQTRQGAASQSQGLDVAQLTSIILAVVKGLVPIIRDTIKSTIQQEKTENPNVNKEIIDLKIELDNANQYSRKDSCRISGLDEGDGKESNEALVEKIVDLGVKTGANIEKADISVAHRLPAQINGVKQTIVKFTSRHAKESFYRSRTKLKNITSCKSVFITEDLTKLRYKLMQQCKKCTGFSGLTTSGGKILVWRDGFPDPVHITHPKDLTKLELIPDYHALGLA